MNTDTDNATREQLAALQDEACTALSAIIDKTATLLMQDAEAATDKAAASPLTAQHPLRLGAESTRRRQAWANAREAAEMLVIGALINKDNPNWDPHDPASSVAADDSAILRLLLLDPDRD